jgi:signal transduction histidine kinase/ligand-binding sensor domain-containing protein
MQRRAVLALAVFLAGCPSASALNPSFDIDQYAHTAWTVRDGFFKGIIFSIAQTPDGYLWLGTEFGIVRFDGVYAVPFQLAGQLLRDTRRAFVLGATDGRLWIGGFNGLVSWKDGKLTSYPALAGWQIRPCLEDHEGTIWAAGFRNNTSKFCAIRGASIECHEEGGHSGYNLYEDSRGNLWAGELAELLRWKPGPPKLYRTPDPKLSVHAIIEDENGGLLLALRTGIMRFMDGKVSAYALPGGAPQVNPRVMMRDRNGGLWIGTSQGLLHVHHGRTDAFTHSDGLSGDNVMALFEDREGNVWAATTGGLDRFRDFTVPTISSRQGLSGDEVISILAASDGSFWMSTATGLNRWREGQNTIYRKRSAPVGSAPKGTTQEIAGMGLPDDFTESLFEDGHGRIWVSTLRGLAYFEHGRFVGVSGPFTEYFRSIAGDAAGNLWISQDESLFHLIGDKVVDKIPWTSLGHNSRADALVSDPLEGGVWLGFYDGGVAYFKDGHVRASYGVAEGLGKGRIAGLQFDRDGTLWAATEGGLSRLKNGRVTTLSTSNGLPCDTVHWALDDDDRSLWLYSACGLVRIKQAELQAWVKDPKRIIATTIFDSSSGVSNHSIVAGASPRVARSKDGKIWFTHTDGVSVLDPRNIPFNTIPPPVHIEQIIADRKNYDPSSNLRLPALSRDLQIDYTALSFVAPEKIQFRYKLEGRDRDWQNVGNRRQAFYSDLAPRKYRFRVIASNNSGVWNEAGDALDFYVYPAYYQTSWFKASCAIVFLALLWALYRYRLHQVAREFNVRLEERVGERTRVARDLHDTLLQSFQGLMLRLQVVDDLLPQGKAKAELELTLERADQAIAEGREAVYDLRSSTTVTNDLAQAIKSVASELANGASTTFRLVVEGPVRDLHPIVRDELYRIAREALRNAFTHAHARHIEAEITYADRLIRLRIRDDGQGIPPAILEQGREGHYGLPGMRERAKQIGAELSIWSGAGAGTEIDLTIASSIAYRTPPGRSRLHLFRRKAG